MGKHFDICFEFTLNEEGGLSNDKYDAGGKTKYGISHAAYPELDIENLTIEDAKAIYERDYWNKVYGEELPLPLALYTFDVAVNSGPHRAITMLQSVVGAKQDGVLGAKTLESVGRANLPLAVEQFHNAREAYFRSRPTFDHFGRGWLKRNNRCRDFAMALTEGE